MRIPFGNPKIGKVARDRLEKAIAKSWASEGENVREFEKLFSEKFGYKHAIAVSSGTDADIVANTALYDLGAKRGDEIITPALAFVATANSILAAGFMPKFVDIRVDTLNLDPAKIEAAITGKTRAIQVVHTMGKPCDMDSILAIARARKLTVIEDACEAHGATYKGRVVGTLGAMGAFSFFAAHLVYSGEGGMVVTNDDRLAEICRSVKSHGRPAGSNYFDFQRMGYNSKMNDLEAALGIEGTLAFDDTFNRRKAHLVTLLALTKDLRPFAHFLVEEEHEKISPHAFSLVLKDEKHGRDALYAFLESKEIQCKTLFGCLPTQHKAFEWMGHRSGEFPAAEFVGRNGLHFGVHQGLSSEDIDYVSDQLHAYFKRVK
ncbi:DegT/DnrJ/EryC1/StrS family aminotransferase [bacterium]|nr:DegT/DnrJ/EryC1/StrS family aminotransferase [bacterium]